MTRGFLAAIFICTTFAMQAQPSASEPRVNETFRKTPLPKALKTIQKKLNVKIAFDHSLAQNIIVTLELKDADINNSLEQLLKHTPLTFTKVGDSYIVIRKPPEEKAAIVEIKNVKVSGSVVDIDTEETLPQATIRIKYTNIATASNNDGYFSLLNVPGDTCSLEVMYLGYVTQTIRVRDIPDFDRFTIKLSSDARILNEVVVLGEYNHAMHVEDLPSTFVFNPKSVANLPSLGEQDMSRTLQLLPGISATDESSSGMIIRGAHPSYNLTLLDGMTIYQQDHFFGAFSIINADIIKDVHITRGMFDAKYGGRASGVVDITTKNGNAVKPSFSVKMNLMNFKGSAELPLGKKWSLFVAGRRSFTDVAQSKLFTTLFDIASASNDQVRYLTYDFGQGLPTYYFYDLNSKLTFRPTARDVVSLSMYGSRDKMHSSDSLSFGDEFERYFDQREEITRWGNNGLSLRWARQWSDRHYSNLRISSSTFFREWDYRNRIIFTNDDGEMNVDYGVDSENSIKDISYALDNEWTVTNKLSVGLGLLGTRQNTKAHIVASLPEDIDETEAFDSWLNSLYASAKMSPLEKLTAIVGARVSHYYNEGGNLYFEPRASLQYKIKEQINLKAGYARSNQFITQQFNYTEKGTMSGMAEQYWILANPNDVRYPVISCDHFTGGVTLRSPQFVYDVEVYYKASRGVIIDDNFNSASTTAYGLDLIIQKTSGIHTGWIAYSLGRGTQTHPYILNGRAAPTLQDQRHELKIVDMLTLGNWNLSSTVLYGSGKPYPKYDVRYYRDGNGLITDAQAVLDYSNTSRLPAYFSLDLAAAYKFHFKKGIELELGASVHNVTDHRNIKTRRIDQAALAEAEFTNTELPPVYNDIVLLGFSPSFFVNFSF